MCRLVSQIINQPMPQIFVIQSHKKNETILFELSGNKMQGRYALIKTKIGGRKLGESEDRGWLFFKRK